jgi:hypothetical protein
VGHAAAHGWQGALAVMKPSIEDILVVMPEVERLLGVKAAQIRKMTLRELSDAAFKKGFRWQVRETGGLVKGLTIGVSHDGEAVAT